MYTWSWNLWKIPNDFLVLKILLRDVKRGNDIFDEIVEQNFQGLDYINKDFVKSMIKEKSKEIIIFLDGVDEFNIDSYSFKTFIYDQNCDVQTVLWSRNWKARQIQHNCDLIFHLKGFDFGHLLEFFGKCFKYGNQAEIFFETVIDKNTTLQEFCRVPFLAMIIFHLWKEKGDLNNMSLYKLYKNIVELLQSKRKINENILDEGLKNKFFKGCLEFLPENTNNLKLSEEEIKILEKVYGGLLHFIIKKNSVDDEVEVQFYHLSLQEYFAANYLIDKYEMNNMEEADKVLSLMFEKYPQMKLFNVLNFLSAKSVELGVEILTQSKYFEKMNKTEWISDRLDDCNNRSLHLNDEEINPSLFQFLVQNGKLSTQELQFKACTFLNFESFSKSLQMSQTITDVKISSNFYIPPIFLPEMLNSFSNGGILSFFSLDCFDKWRIIISRVEEKFFSLTVILDQMIDDMQNSFDKSLEQCQMLKALHIEISNKCLKVLNGTVLNSFLKTIPKLEYLDNIHFSKPEFGKKLFLEIFKSLPKSIKKLSIETSVFKLGTYSLLCDSMTKNSSIDGCPTISISIIGSDWSCKDVIYSILFEKDVCKTENSSPNMKRRKINSNFNEYIDIFFLFPKPCVSQIPKIELKQENYSGNHIYLKRIVDHEIIDWEKLSKSYISVKFLGLLNSFDCFYLSKILNSHDNLVKGILLGDCREMENNGFEKIFEGLKPSCNSISTIVFQHCPDSNFDYCNVIGTLLEYCSNLSAFKMSLNQETPGEFKCKSDLRKIIDGLQISCITLSEIVFQKFSITDQDGYLLGELFKTCTSLKEINLEESKFYDSALDSILFAIEDCTENLASFKYSSFYLTNSQIDNLEILKKKSKYFSELME
ncbi:unnamed protein product [Dimorphilus gyrociliatus]|uniref:Uncharacterized protein n=1 Tax=Dimorphilus gyrociliatus TaxID=2664684 RepID=A0A7I8WF44_9ANNE|nr:unnamed protein product [Dimorphilus gyrociliatus]